MLPVRDPVESMHTHIAPTTSIAGDDATADADDNDNGNGAADDANLHAEGFSFDMRFNVGHLESSAV